MKNKFLFSILVLLVLFIVNIFWSTGFFRTIENKFEGEILKKINLKGAEDITINKIDSFAIISSTLRKSFPKTEQETGGLYFLDLKNNNYDLINLTTNFKKPFAPHGISIFKKDSINIVAAINHTLNGEFIEIFELIGNKLIHKKTLEHDLIYSPNDIVLLDENRFYFTNDHKYKTGIKRLAEDYLGLAISNVIYFDGMNFIEVANKIIYANGINFDPKRNLVFVASVRGFLVKVYKKNKDNSLTFIENIYCNTGVDNIEFDSEYNLWIGAHPSLLHFDFYAKGNKKISPSEIIKINYIEKGNYLIKQIYIEKGNTMSGSTVAAPIGNLIFTGNVMDKHFLILQNKN
tara:strand:+ start:618 stop:1658 length:1041 start_codon:yes stop_codon:yes gene_type:complete